MPPFHSKQIIPVPAPTAPSATGPLVAPSTAPRTSDPVICVRRASLRVESSHSPIMGMTTRSVPSVGSRSQSSSMRPSQALPTCMVEVSTIGVSRTPDSAHLDRGRELAGTVEDRHAGRPRGRQRPQRCPAGHDGRDAGAGHAPAHRGIGLVPPDGGVTDEHSRHIGDGIERPRREQADLDAQVPGAGAGAGRHPPDCTESSRPASRLAPLPFARRHPGCLCPRSSRRARPARTQAVVLPSLLRRPGCLCPRSSRQARPARTQTWWRRPAVPSPADGAADDAGGVGGGLGCAPRRHRGLVWGDHRQRRAARAGARAARGLPGCRRGDPRRAGPRARGPRHRPRRALPLHAGLRLRPVGRRRPPRRSRRRRTPLRTGSRPSRGATAATGADRRPPSEPSWAGTPWTP